MVASSAFRRLPRIGLPAFLATCLAWTLTQMGAFSLIPELETDIGWLHYTTPRRVEGIFASLQSLIRETVFPISKMEFDDSLTPGLTPTTHMSGINGLWGGKCEDQCWSFWFSA